MKILVVDDDSTIRLLVSTILKKEGHEIRGAVRGVEAIKELQAAQDIDLVITDLNMPGMSGIELLEVVDALKGLRQRPAFLLMTAMRPGEMTDAQSAEVAKAIETGFDAVIPKSIDRAGLVKAVNSLKTRSRRMMARKRLSSARPNRDVAKA
jgi:CheY-like chemotaxis protein